MHLKHMSEHYANEISSQIIGLCLAKQVSLIVLPKYKKEYTDYVMIEMCIRDRMYSPRDLYFAGKIRLLVIRFMVRSGQLLWSEKWRISLYTGFFRSCRLI